MKAYIYTCFDPKVWPTVVDIFDERFSRGSYFLDADPGAAKNLVSPTDARLPKIVISKIKAAYTLHPFETLVIINHSKCGAYKLAGVSFDNAAAEEAFHKKELDRAVVLLKREFPKLKIESHYFLKESDKLKW